MFGFKKMAERADRKSWADLEARLLEEVAQEDRLDRLVVVQVYGNPPVQQADDGYLYFTSDYVYYAPRTTRALYGYPLQRLVGYEWDPEPGVLVLHVAMEGEPGTGAAFCFKPHLTPSPLIKKALERLVAATEACPPLPEDELWPTD